jgi:hypothetical protein
MKFKIVAESNKGKIEIPLTTREIRALGDLSFWFGDADWKDFKLNKIEKDVGSLIEKWMFLNYDVLDDGRCYKMDFRKGKTKLVFSGHHYISKKPKWKK